MSVNYPGKALQVSAIHAPVREIAYCWPFREVEDIADW
jgi:hypothetical protein